MSLLSYLIPTPAIVMGVTVSASSDNADFGIKAKSVIISGNEYLIHNNFRNANKNDN